MKTSYIYILIIAVIVGGLILVRNNSEQQAVSTLYDGFGQCLADAGAIFYGAYWCPHCNEQKKMFEYSEAIPYVECSTPNGQDRTQVCIEENIESYPTWKFADGEVLQGVRELSELAEKTGCELPVAEG